MHKQFNDTFSRQCFVPKAISAKEYSEINFTVSDVKKLSIEYMMSDIWSLASLLTSESFINIFDDNDDDGNLDYQNEIKPEWTLEELIKHTDNDRRIRKSRLLIGWLESSYKKKVLSLNKLRNATWPVTLRRILNGSDYSTKSFEVNSAHPDAQLHKRGFLISLDGNDKVDQETLLRHVFQLLRCGEIRQAQQVALDNEVYWLVSSLQGVANIFYQQETDVDNERQLCVMRRGNARRPVWIRTCWKYADKLCSSKSNFTVDVDEDTLANQSDISTVATLIEMSIYASLSNNTKVLLQSPLVTTFADKLWVIMKAAHESSLDEIIHYHRVLKSNHSSFYPGCSQVEIQAEREIIHSTKEKVAQYNFPSITYHELFDVVSPPLLLNDAESLLLQLQVAFMKGRNSLQEYIENTIKPVITSNAAFPYREDVLLTYCILILWIYKPTQCDSTDQLIMMQSLSEIASDSTLHMVVEAYIDNRIESDNGVLIMPYLQPLCKVRRVAKFLEYIVSIEKRFGKLIESERTVINDVITSATNHLSDEEMTNLLLLIVSLQFQDRGILLLSSFDSLQICGKFCFKSFSSLDSFQWLCLDSFSFFKVEHMIRTITNQIAREESIDSIEPIMNELLSSNKNIVRSMWDMNIDALDPLIIFPLHGNKSNFIESLDLRNVYTSVKDIILLFIQYSQALNSFDLLRCKIQEFELQCSHIKVNMFQTIELNVSEIESAARVAQSHILSIIQCDEADYTASGITKLWKNSEMACMTHFKISVLSLEEAVSAIYENLQILIERYQQQEESGVVDSNIVGSQTFQVLDNFINLFNRAFPSESSSSILNNDIYNLCVTLMKRIPEAVNSMTGLAPSSFVSDLIYSVELNLFKCISSLQDMIQIRKSSRIMTSSLIGKFIDISIEMDSIFSFLKNDDHANYWKSQALTMLSIIATEDSSLKLYNTISRNDLKVHMKKIMKVVVDNNFI